MTSDVVIFISYSIIHMILILVLNIHLEVFYEISKTEQIDQPLVKLKYIHHKYK